MPTGVVVDLQHRLQIGLGCVSVYHIGAEIRARGDGGELAAALPAPFDCEFPETARAPLDLAHLIDAVIAAGLLLFTLPLLACIALAVKFCDGGPILFSHERIGFGGRAFRCWKFRSMSLGAEAKLAEVLATDPAARSEWEATHKLQIDPRITPVGRIIRMTSVDELPQLFNVVRGDMALVGPRPIVAAEVPRYGRAIRHYTALRPGITGLWQVSGRSDTTYRRRVALDVLYARRRSLRTNLEILFCTFGAVVARSGSY